MIEHHIQRSIIDRLMRAPALRFSGLKPAGMESNIFMYHLKQLIKQKYVEKTVEGAYRLAPTGLSYVDRLSVNLKPREQPKLIAILALHDEAGRWLLAERKAQPYIGTRMFISGKRHRGEHAGAHAARELHEKTGLQAELRQRGMADIQIYAATGELLTHAVALVYEGIVPADAAPPEADRLRYVWHDFADVRVPLMPGTRELYEQLGAGNQAFAIDLSLTEGVD